MTSGALQSYPKSKHGSSPKSKHGSSIFDNSSSLGVLLLFKLLSFGVAWVIVAVARVNVEVAVFSCVGSGDLTVSSA